MAKLVTLTVTAQGDWPACSTPQAEDAAGMVLAERIVEAVTDGIAAAQTLLNERLGAGIVTLDVTS